MLNPHFARRDEACVTYGATERICIVVLYINNGYKLLIDSIARLLHSKYKKILETVN